MDKHRLLIPLLVLLLCNPTSTDPQTSCPLPCQCFTPQQVLCADDRMSSLPTNLSRHVRDLIVMTSPLAYLFPHTLEASPQITKLVFLNNALRSIHSQAFENLTELQELEISGSTWLDNLFLGTFSKQRNLVNLLLNYNQLKTVLPGMFDSLTRLKTLQMKGNIISHLPDFLFRNLQTLHTLDLSLNKLRGMTNETLSGLSSLKILKINHNLIRNFTSDTFRNMSQLSELHLEGNQISELSDGIFSSLTELKVLNLRGNHLTAFTKDVFGFNGTNLKKLNLKGNQLTELSSLSYLPSLVDLNLSSNRLSHLTADIFKNVTRLENIDLSENLLTSLPEGIFRELFSIQTLHLQKNNLSRLDAKLFEDQLLIQQVYLSDNRLENLPLGLLDPFVDEYTVRLHGNPWRCDCQMWYLHDWMIRFSRPLDMRDQVLCSSPGFLKQRTLESLDREQLVCPLSPGEVPDLRNCSVQALNDTLVVKCKVDKCSPLTVKVQFQDDDGNVSEGVLKKDTSECSNHTGIDEPAL